MCGGGGGGGACACMYVCVYGGMWRCIHVRLVEIFLPDQDTKKALIK